MFFPSQITGTKQCFADLGEYTIEGNFHVSVKEEEKNQDNPGI